MAGCLLDMRDISVDESEELPQILHPLVNDAPAAVAGRGAALPPTSEGQVRAQHGNLHHALR